MNEWQEWKRNLWWCLGDLHFKSCRGCNTVCTLLTFMIDWSVYINAPMALPSVPSRCLCLSACRRLARNRRLASRPAALALCKAFNRWLASRPAALGRSWRLQPLWGRSVPEWVSESVSLRDYIYLLMLLFCMLYGRIAHEVALSLNIQCPTEVAMVRMRL